ncbi:MAG: O-antigen ligase family protein [Planctomycetaceae bacterium]|jgi:O-antigen ligase|nr:O-antigen ligase family protein [Planctomycetaceae bacterium]
MSRNKNSNTKNSNTAVAAHDSFFIDIVASVLTAMLFGVCFVHPGDMMFQTGCGHLVSCLWFVLVAGWLVARFLFRQKYRGVSLCSLRFTAADLFLLAFLFWSLVVSPVVQRGSDNFSLVNQIFTWCAAAAAWFMFRQLFVKRELIYAAAVMIIALAFWESVFAIAQEYIIIPDTVRTYSHNPESFLVNEGIDPSPDSPLRKLFESRLATATPTGSYLLTNTLGGQLAFAFVLCAGGLFFFNMKTQSRQRLTVVIIVVLTILVALWFTQCRSAMGALLAGFAMLECYRRDLLRVKRNQRPFMKKTLAVAIVAVMLCGAYAAVSCGAGGGHGLFDGATKSLGYRMIYWQTSLRMIAERPVFGCGLGNFSQNYLRYKPVTASEEIIDPHNAFAELAACTGIPGVLLFAGFLTAVFYHVATRNENDELPQRNDDAGELKKLVLTRRIAIAGFMSVIFHPFLSDNFDAMTLLIVLTVIVFAAVLQIIPMSNEKLAKWLQPALLVTAICTLLFHLLAAGGINYLNVQVTLLVTIALLLNLCGDEQRKIPTAVEGTIGITAAAAFVLCYVFLFLPLTNATHYQNEFAASIAERVKNLEQVVKCQYVIPYANQTELLDARLLYWEEKPDDIERRKKLEEEIDATIKIAGSKATVLMHVNDVMERIEKITGDKSNAEKFIEIAKQAVRNYPNYALPHATLARAYNRYNTEHGEMIEERDIALKLDDMMTHEDKKLPLELRTMLEQFR